MANTLFPKARESFLKGTSDWTDGRIRALLYADLLLPDRIAAGDYPFVSSLTFASILARSSAPAAFTATNGYAACQEFEFLSFTSAVPVQSIILFFSSPLGGDAASLLVAYISVADPLPFTGAGESYAVVHDASFGGYFQL